MSIEVKDPETKNKVEIPKKYVAIIKNDDYTSFDFVERVLQIVFNHPSDAAKAIAMDVHNKGEGVAGGPYQYDVCETKCTEAMDIAKRFEMPLYLEPREA